MSRYLTFTLAVLLCSLSGWAQDLYPSVSPAGIYTTADGEEVDEVAGSQSAPFHASFFANPSNVGDYTARYEWKIWKEGEEEELLVHRFEENIEYQFLQSGSFCVQLYATFVNGNDTIAFPGDGEDNPIRISISESKLEFPNAISPNGDDYNDVLRAKDGWQSIVSFEAAVFNRWGTKLFSWSDISSGWDGKYNGSVVRDGVYFLVVNAKGADGHKFNIRKTISVLTTSHSEALSEGGNE